MKPRSWKKWSGVTEKELRGVKVVAFDLDDTLTEEGALPGRVIQELERVSELRSDLKLVLVTGRPCGWADALVKLLPFDGIVAENGAAIFFWKEGRRARGARERPVRRYWSEEGYVATFSKNDDQKTLEHLCRKVLAQFPRTCLASDQAYRLYDVAIDFAEEVDPPLELSKAYEIAHMFQKEGYTAKVSSIHVNAWKGDFTKHEGLEYLLGSWPQKARLNDVLYVGDSPNDDPLFRVVGLSVGVANVLNFEKDEQFQGPQYVTSMRGGAGSVEILSVFKKKLKP